MTKRRNQRKKIAIVHPFLTEAGGSEARALWMAEAFKDEYDVHVLTMEAASLDRLNRYYGTDLREEEVTVTRVPLPAFSRSCFDALKGFRLTRYCRDHAADYDLMVCTYNVMDFGVTGVQFIADFSFDDSLRAIFDASAETTDAWRYRPGVLRNAYLKIGKLLSGQCGQGWKKNITVANSLWSREIMQARFGMDTPVIYPPVRAYAAHVPWEKKENGVVYIGRIAPEKRIETIIRMIKEVRRRGHALHLHIAGRLDDSAYARSLQRCARLEGDWISFEGVLSGEEKMRFLDRHKYGISAREHEPFGIAIAEMIKAGCIVWVPQGGGQAEIVDHPCLTYQDPDDCVGKICGLLRDEALQRDICLHLAEQKEQFSTTVFMEKARLFITACMREKEIPHEDRHYSVV